MCLQDLIIMSKRFKYFISSLFSALGFFMFISLPYESRYFGLMAGVVLVIFCFWFGLGIIFEKSFYTRLMAILLPACFFVGFGMFVAFLPYNALVAVLLSVFFGFVLYVLFLVENVFLVAIGFKTVPLYRAAYTVSLIVMLLAAFFMFNSLYSFRLNFIWNMVWVFLISTLLFLYQYWAIAIELPDDGKGKSLRSYVFVPALMLAELALVFSFWPTGIFKGSMYLVSVIYIISGLIQADIRDRLFKRVWMMYLWVGIAVISATVIITGWKQY
jgi:hypothetical protein